ncbi:3-hydroxy-3-methylglutaryl coenzyme A synthase [Brettanomyces nanus]|uniref:Hydroxymethylglutaryl-CoA synthase n=1 Tax=Eeniella nana TaxID=13502 RepID=A0A875S4B0_EENNA|nr:3-hydroxy-3-methylglutaryl coenzyme A synthase [Brettanomyces nanus]QPG75205.1 3-hydroxy-3-methylglutaryl coenzyme A synthase [Brettanomyces nanus]
MSPEKVGIKALEVYIPGQYVHQGELEKYDGVSTGKYTIGLGQKNMAFVNDREDIYSMALTVLKNLISKYSVDTNNIGRLEVGTETLLDKSKSIKTFLMQLFGDNTDVEGIDTLNACYGGTAAVINAINWVQSDSWDGRDAIVVCGDIAIYDKGAARPTGGAGTVALLIGPDAPIVFDPVRGSYMEHAYDFYKPDFNSEYPYVDGHYSLACYVKAVDFCYKAYSKKAIARGLSESKGSTVGLDYFDYNAFHSPTCKLVIKSYARLMYNDYLDNTALYPDLDPKVFRDIPYEKSLVEKAIEKKFMALSKEKCIERVKPSLELPTNIGNTYTGSCWGCLSSLLYYVGNEKLQGKRIGLFSYGSGLAATLMSMKVVGDISKITKILDIQNRLDSRLEKSPKEYESAIELRESAYMKKPFKPVGDTEYIPDGTYYLKEVDDKFRRTYSLKGEKN